MTTGESSRTTVRPRRRSADFGNLRCPDFVEGVAIVLADIEQSPTTGGQEPGPLPFSPHALLRTQVEALAVKGLTPIMAPELEFYVFRRDDAAPHGWRPYLERDTAGYVVGVANDVDDLLTTLIRRCQVLDLGVFAGNHEFSAGQFEINHRHSEAIDAADRAFLFKHAVKEIATPGIARDLYGQAV